MKKKNILILALAASMIAVLAVGGTLAYFTDNDSRDNTFTVGSVKIKLIEQQRTEDGTALEDFVDDKVLMPIVGSAQGESVTVEGVVLPTAANYVDKIVKVENTGKSAAYVRVYLAIPAALDDDDASKNVLHVNYGFGTEWTGTLPGEKVTIDGEDYIAYPCTYNAQLAPGETTAVPAYKGVYLDSHVDMDKDGNYTINGNVIDFNFENGITLPVFAQAVQAAGFDTADDAFAASGLTNPWVK